MSTFMVPVVRIGAITKHANADSLSITQVDGENVIFRTGEFNEGDLAVYVPVDAVVPMTVPGTEFLGERPKDRRIRAKRLRGVYSEGLLLPASVIPVNVTPKSICFGPGDDVGDYLGIRKYEDEVPDEWGTRPNGISIPGKKGLLGRFLHWCFRDELRTVEKDPGCIPHYDIEPYKKNKHILTEGSRVVVTEKIHGTNFRASYLNGKLYVGSRNQFWRDLASKNALFREKLGEFVRTKVLRHKKRNERKTNLYWHTAHQYGLKEKLARFPGLAFYGEVYGQVQDLKYGAVAGQTWLRVFDIYDTNGKFWLPWDTVRAICHSIDLETVPVLYDGPYSEAALEPLVEGKSVLADNIREGIVVKDAYANAHEHFGLIILKWVSQQYKLRRGGTELH